MPKNDVSLQSSMTAEPEPDKMAGLFLAWIDLLRRRRASPNSLAGHLDCSSGSVCCSAPPSVCSKFVWYESVTAALPGLYGTCRASVGPSTCQQHRGNRARTVQRSCSKRRRQGLSATLGSRALSGFGLSRDLPKCNCGSCKLWWFALIPFFASCAYLLRDCCRPGRKHFFLYKALF